MPQPVGTLFVGSVPLDTTHDVFRKICSTVPGRVERIPDGETGSRHYFTRFQTYIFPPSIRYGATASNTSSDLPSTLEQLPPLLKDLRTGYDDAAVESYAVFRELRSQGIIPKNVKFQVCLPGTMDGLFGVDPKYRAATEPYYEKALFAAARRIQDEIPHEDLAIQWDFPVEIAMLERVYEITGNERSTPWFDPVDEGVMERMVRCTKEVVDEDVDMGIHWCYGDSGHRHFIEPKDVGLMVRTHKELARRIGRKIAWVHMPVPKDRDDPEYFQPLTEIEALIKNGTKLYLGLVHAGDEEGTRRRIDTAGKVLGGIEFGVATECGMGRTPREQLDNILEISAKVAKPLQRL